MFCKKNSEIDSQKLDNPFFYVQAIIIGRSVYKVYYQLMIKSLFSITLLHIIIAYINFNKLGKCLLNLFKFIVNSTTIKNINYKFELFRHTQVINNSIYLINTFITVLNHYN